MKISGNFTKAAELQRPHQPQYAASQTQKGEDISRRFDSVTISEENGRSFGRELQSRIFQEVRTETTSGMIATLREQIQNGTYHPDPTEIARKMLLFGEAV